MDADNSAENHSVANNCSVSTPEGNDSKNAALRRTPFSKFRKVHSSFKSPLQVTECSKCSPEEEVEELQRNEDQLDTEITQLEAEGYRVEELERHIDMLHEYNDIKDIGQTLLGRIGWFISDKRLRYTPCICEEAYWSLCQTQPGTARHGVNKPRDPPALRGTTTRDLYSHFGLELDD